jgi:tRNA(Ile2)-agmatinylcytidine synthase
MTWVGIDDTDSPQGGCTTFVLTELLRVAEEHGVDLIGHPRLVRLNPNAPGRTRGNAALSARFGRGRGPGRTVGRVEATAVRAFARGDPLPRAAEERFLEAAWGAVRRSSAYPAPRTDPAMVASRRRLPADLYWEAVRRQLSVAPVAALLEGLGAWHRHLGSDSGLVGAAAAVSWPGGHPTWELIAYREPGRGGARRGPSARSLARLERRYPELFQCRDRRTRRVLVTPHTPCPILLGLRATSPARLPAALGELDTEPVSRWVVFRSNQGTGDHLVDRPVAALAPYDSARLTGAVESPPRPMPGGHWWFRLLDRGGASAIDCVAFEPTKTLPPVVRRLVPGDRVRLWGSLGSGPPFRIEGVELVAARPRSQLGPLPKCAACQARLRSLGRLRGYRCSRCSRRYPPEIRPSVGVGVPPARGVYHPTPSARRHLAPRAPESPDGRGPGVRLLRRERTDLYR